MNIPSTTRPGKVALAVVTAATMAIATFPVVVFGVLATDLLAEFDADRWQIGALVTANAIVGALLSPYFGNLTDRLGATRSTAYALLAGAATLTLISISPTYLVLIGVTLLSGVPQGWCNPATNALIVQNVPEGKRGALTGIKQSGVQVGIFLGGLTLPALAGWLNWRAAVAVFLVLPLIGLIGLRRDHDEHRISRHETRSGPVPHFIHWVTVYGFISGLGTSAMLTFLPLFAQEDQLWRDLHAGWLIAGVGLVGIAARIGWGMVSHSWFGHGRTLRILAVLSTLSAALLALAAADLAESWVLIPAAALLGAGGVAWNSVGMLAVMDYSPAELVGRGTGRVLFGFLFGLGVGAPLMGFSVDVFDSYLIGWVTIAVIFMIATTLTGKIREPAGTTS